MEFNINSIDIPKQPLGSAFCSTFSIIGFINNLLPHLDPPLNPNNFVCRAVDAFEINDLIQQIKSNDTIKSNPNSKQINEIIDSLVVKAAINNKVESTIFNGVIDPASPNGNYKFFIISSSGSNAHWTIANVIIDGNTVTINTYDTGNRVKVFMDQMYRESFVPQLRSFLEGAGASSMTNEQKLRELQGIFVDQDVGMLTDVLRTNDYNLEQTINQLLIVLSGGSSNKRRYFIKY